MEKVLQLHIACSQRIGIIIVGPSGSGKSSLWQILEGAYKKLGRPVKPRDEPELFIVNSYWATWTWTNGLTESSLMRRGRW